MVLDPWALFEAVVVALAVILGFDVGLAFLLRSGQEGAGDDQR